MNTKYYIIISVFILAISSLPAQTLPDSLRKTLRSVLDTVPVAKDTLSSILDSLQNVQDQRPAFAPPDTRTFPGNDPPPGAGGSGGLVPPLGNLSDITISEEAVDENVEYESQDSMFFDVKNKQIHLYGQAIVKYLSMTIEAEYIIIDWNDNTITAEGRKQLGKTIGKPKFTESSQTFSSSKMKYNFKTRKGIIYDAVSEQEGMQVHGEKAKFISAVDSTKNDVIYNSKALITSCQHSHPHFGVRSRKQKVVPEKVAIVGPSNIEIMGIPTPLVLPFGFFPLKQGKRTGLLFDSYENSRNFGFGLRGLGWYFPINDNWDLQLTGDAYFKGTFRVYANTRYNKRYKYSGGINLNIAYLREENAGGELQYNPSFGIRWSHNQDSKAHPNRTFRGSLNLQTNGYARNNEFDAQSQLNSSLSSNVAMNWRSVGPFTISTSFNHSQNTLTRDVRIQFPNLSVQSQTMYPFKRKKPSGKKQWYEEISLRYSGEARNQMTAKDSTLFTAQTLRDAEYGIRHSANSSVNFNLFKFFNVSPNVNYKEVWYMESINKTFDPTLTIEFDTLINPQDSNELQIIADTTSFGNVITSEDFGFASFREFSLGVSMRTKLYGMVQFKKGWLRGVRHVITPNISFNYSPDYTNPGWGYFREVQTNAEGTDFDEYSIFDGGIFGKPSSSGKQMNVSFRMVHDFEAKYFSKKDSSDKKLTLFRGFSMSISHNFARDTLKWSQLRMGGTTSFFNSMTNVTLGLTYDPYAPSSPTNHKSRINTFWYDQTGNVLRFVEGSINVATSLTVKRIRDLFKGVNSDVMTGGRRSSGSSGFGGAPPPGGGTEGRQTEDKGPDDLLQLFDNTSIRHNFRINWNPDTAIVSANAIAISAGNIPITENWNVRIGNIGYDFKSKRLTYPDFSFSRDLHCWEMGVSWRPEYSIYNFFIKVKPGRLDFINIPYGKNPQDTFGFR